VCTATIPLNGNDVPDIEVDTVVKAAGGKGTVKIEPDQAMRHFKSNCLVRILCHFVP